MRFVSAATAAVIAASALTIGTLPANAAYLGLRGSLVETDDDNSTSVSIDYTQKYDDVGFATGIYLGWVLDEDFRFEAAVDYRNNDLDSIHIIRNDFDNSTEGNTYRVDGQAEAVALMGNFFYDIHAFGDLGFLPWVGAGVGGAYIRYSANQPTTFAQDEAWVFAYQLMAGITVPLADHLSGSVGYRWFQTRDFKYADQYGLVFKTDLTQQSIDLGLQLHF
ncbi:MAG: outer membrane beta-barrel protein [Alphaproteobacteria bacterium]|nr:outer membrane beta-barrel protein [Alphaproteobacteria bacterium]